MVAEQRFEIGKELFIGAASFDKSLGTTVRFQFIKTGKDPFDLAKSFGT